MGNSKVLNSLTVENRKELAEKLWRIQNHKCFICGEDIDLELQKYDIDHICPLATGGKDDESNFAITHDHCNRSKQDANLQVARSMATLDKIIKKAEDKNETPSLNHVLEYYGGAKYDFKCRVANGELIYTFDDIGKTEIKKSEIFTDELSKEQSAFISVPIEYLFHDGTINPRGLNSSVSLLIKEFYKSNPQLQIALARIDDGKIKLFDGQHKTVAQIMLGVRSILVRLFINPDEDRLIETNLNAGKQLRQIAFDKAIVRQLHNAIYTERIKKYQKDHNLTEDCYDFSEQDVVEHFKGERAKVYIVNSQKDAITHDEQNKLKSYINFEGRGYSLPLSYSTFEKTLLSSFVGANTILTTPINYRVDEGLNPRTLEKDQLVHLCNLIADNLLVGRYDESIGTNKIENSIVTGQGSKITDEHLIACRLFKEEVMHSWLKYVKDVIKHYVATNGIHVDDDKIFQTKFPDQLWTNIQNFLENLHNLPLWKDRGMAATIFGGKKTLGYWDAVFGTGKTPDGITVLSKPLNILEMIQK